MLMFRFSGTWVKGKQKIINGEWRLYLPQFQRKFEWGKRIFDSFLF